jgi:hypothetical protein
VTLLFAVLHLAVVLLIFLVATAWGYRVLEGLGCEAQSNLETVLFAFAALEIVLLSSLLPDGCVGSAVMLPEWP